MKYCILCFGLFILLFFVSCNNKHEIKIENIDPIDSFVVDFGTVNRMYRSKMSVEGNYIISLPVGDNVLSFYPKTNEKQYGPTVTSHVISTTDWHWSYLKLQHDSLYLLGSRELLILDKNSYRGRKLIVSGTLEHLGDNFHFFSPTFNTSIIRNDTLYSGFYFDAKNRTSDYIANLKAFFKEPPISMYLLVGDSLKYLKGIFKVPEKKLFQSENIGKYSCISSSQYSLIYGCLDTIYTYDFNTSATKKINIKNPFYKKNNKYDWNILDQSYWSTYNVENFNYTGFYLSPITHNYVLFFDAPYLDKKKIPYDNKVYALVLNQKYKILHVYDLGRKYYGYSCMLEVPGKGIAFPLVKKQNEQNEKVTYHIYNF